jgi:hypothetical protein
MAIKKYVVFNPQSKYIDRTAAAFQQNLVPTFVDRGVSLGQCGGSPQPLISVF